jgi:hypothetical protein
MKLDVVGSVYLLLDTDLNKLREYVATLDPNHHLDDRHNDDKYETVMKVLELLNITL